MARRGTQWGRARINPRRSKLVEAIDQLKNLKTLIEERHATTLEELGDVQARILKQQEEAGLRGDG